MMLQINSEFLGSKTAQGESQEPLCEAAEGVPIGTRPLRLGPTFRPVVRGSARDGGKEGPMWRDALLAD
jgi:hypothetical protein